MYSALLVTAAVAALGVAVKLRRPHAALPWWLLFAGLAAFSLRTWAITGTREGFLDPVLLALDLPLFLAGYALTLAAIARFVRVRTGGRDLDGLIDAAIVGCAAAVVVKQWVVPADGLVDATALGMYVVMEAVVVAIAVRLLLLSSDSAAGWLLFTGSVAGLAANLAFVASFAPNRECNDPCTDRLAPPGSVRPTNARTAVTAPP